jgi:Protein of unknown function (DUF3788)
VDIPNAFVGKTAKPTSAEVQKALGSSAKLWDQMLSWFAEEQGVGIQEWKSISPKYGWALRLKRKKRTIVHVSPCAGCFRVVFILGERAVQAARNSALPKSILTMIDEAPCYAEGTGVRLIVKQASDLAAIRKLAVIKLAY